MAVNRRMPDMDEVRRFRESVDRFFGPIVIPPSLLSSTADSQSQQPGSSDREMRQSSKPTRTPETQKPSRHVPNAPIKRRKATKKIDLRPKKLEYTETEVEYQSSIDSGVSYKRSSTRKNPKVKESCSKQNGKKNVQNCDKENIGNIANDDQTDQGYSSNSGPTHIAKNLSKLSIVPNRSQLEEFVESSSDESDISHSGSEASQQGDRRKLLESHQDSGTWIECYSKTCKKWRFTVEFTDPLDVPEKWYCNMNTDPAFASCAVPEEKIPRNVNEQLIENKYRCGSIVWARLDGFPWWPAMVENCPITLLYYKLKGSSIVPIKYHVVFFNTINGNRAWIPERDLKGYVQNPRSNVVNKTTFRSIDYKTRLEIACSSASEAVQYSIADRIEKFGLVARWSKKNQTTSGNLQGGQKSDSTAKGKSVNPTLSKKKRTRSIETESAENIDSGPSKNTRSRNIGTKLADTLISGSSKKTCSKNSERASINEESIIETKYNIGDIVWARPNGFPWWPAIIDTCPIVKLHYDFERVTNIPNKYHVVYFNEEKYETDWRSNRDLKDFASNPRCTVVKRIKFRGTDYSDELADACALAQKAELLSPDQRLNRFGVVARSLSHADKMNSSPRKQREKKSSNFESESGNSSVGSKEAWDAVRASMYSPASDKSEYRRFNFDEINEANAVCSDKIEKPFLSSKSSISNNEPSTFDVLGNCEKNCIPNESSIPNNDSSTSILDNCLKSIEAFERSPPSSFSTHSDELSHFEKQPMLISVEKYSNAFHINSSFSDKDNYVRSSGIHSTQLSTSRLDNNTKYFDSMEISPLSSPSQLSDKLPAHGEEPKSISRNANEKNSLCIKSQILPLNRNEEVAIRSEPEQNDAFSDGPQMSSNCCREEIDSVSNDTQTMVGSNESDIENNDTSADYNYRKYFEKEDMTTPENCPWQSDGSCEFEEEPMSIFDTNNESDSEQSICDLEEDTNFYCDVSEIPIIRCNSEMKLHSKEDHENFVSDASFDFKEEEPMLISDSDSQESNSHLIFRILEGGLDRPILH